MDRKVVQFGTVRIPKSKIAIKKKKWSQLRRAHTNKQRKVNIGTWRLKQTINYIHFLKDNQESLMSFLAKEKSMVYSNMASNIKTRTSLQCRSHHQKMMKTHGSIYKIIQYYTQVAIPFFKRQEKELNDQKYMNQLKKHNPFYKVSIGQRTIRIEIDSSRISHY